MFGNFFVVVVFVDNVANCRSADMKSLSDFKVCHLFPITREPHSDDLLMFFSGNHFDKRMKKKFFSEFPVSKKT